MYSENTFYPMLGVGAFFIMFWVGFVIGYELGFACNSMLINGFIFAAAGGYAVVKLERYDQRRGRVAERTGSSKLSIGVPIRSSRATLQAYAPSHDSR